MLVGMIDETNTLQIAIPTSSYRLVLTLRRCHLEDSLKALDRVQPLHTKECACCQWTIQILTRTAMEDPRLAMRKAAERRLRYIREVF